jgi:hypothetical protein
MPACISRRAQAVPINPAPITPVAAMPSFRFPQDILYVES